MNKLPTAQHRALKVAARNEAEKLRDPYSIHSGNRMQWTHEKKLIKRGYLVHEARRTTEYGWSQMCWLSPKGKQYLGMA